MMRPDRTPRLPHSADAMADTMPRDDDEPEGSGGGDEGGQDSSPGHEPNPKRTRTTQQPPAQPQFWHCPNPGCTVKPIPLNNMHNILAHQRACSYKPQVGPQEAKFLKGLNVQRQYTRK